jgi:hypothetical protein
MTNALRRVRHPSGDNDNDNGGGGGLEGADRSYQRALRVTATRVNLFFTRLIPP